MVKRLRNDYFQNICSFFSDDLFNIQPIFFHFPFSHMNHILLIVDFRQDVPSVGCIVGRDLEAFLFSKKFFSFFAQIFLFQKESLRIIIKEN